MPNVKTAQKLTLGVEYKSSIVDAFITQEEQMNRYKLLVLETTGWGLADTDSDNLTKDECDLKLSQYLGDGISPDRLKVVRVS